MADEIYPGCLISYQDADKRFPVTYAICLGIRGDGIIEYYSESGHEDIKRPDLVKRVNSIDEILDIEEEGWPKWQRTSFKKLLRVLESRLKENRF